MSTVYILGAGASASFDRSDSGMHCPSSKNFFPVACRVIETEPGESFTNYSSIAFFLNKYFMLSFNGIEKAGLDMQDVLTFLDLELEYSNSPAEVELLQKARHEFMDLLTITFNSVLKGPPCPYHAALVSLLGRGDTVISFNYDLLIDTALSNSTGWLPETGYGFDAVVEKKSSAGSPAASKVYLLKPHGSFNWIACRTCGKVYVLPLSLSQSPVKWTSFSAILAEPPEHELERLIIPPSLKKDVHGRVMQQVWKRAHHALKNASRLVIIGYSLPATDFLVKRLLYRALSHNRSLREIELVDRNNSSPSNPLLEKYRRILYNTQRPVNMVHDKKNLKEYVLTYVHNV